MAVAAMSFDQMLDDTVRGAERAVAEHHGNYVDPDAGDWLHDPVDLVTFVESKEHLQLPPLFPRQAAAVRELLGDDPKRVFAPDAVQPTPLPWDTIKGSSNLLRVAYIAPERALYIEFRNGSVYRYPDVAPVEWQGLLRARSKGSFLNQIIKPRGEATRIEQHPDELTWYPKTPGARAYQLAVLLWGKGSGKDYLCSVIVAYLVYIVLCLRDPQGYLELAPGENIDIVNVAYNADQAKKVFFAKFKERLLRWQWLKENFDVHEAGRRKHPDNKGLPKVEINDTDVEFPNKIRCFSRHSQNESYEGLNVLAWIMDEASAFLSAAKRENAEKIYKTLRTSAGSRFGTRWLGFIISFPRHADDFTMTKCAEARRHPEAGIYADGPAKTWEINPLRGRQGYVEVRPGHMVPVELSSDYVLDFEGALAMYECQPPLAADALIKDPDAVRRAVEEGRAPLIEWEPVVNHRTSIDPETGEEVPREFAGIKLTKLGRLAKGAKLFMHGDPARTSDAFALAIGHGVPEELTVMVPASEVLTPAQMKTANLTGETVIPWKRPVQRTVIDALIVWRPDPARRRHVDLLNVQDVLLALTKHYGRGAWGGITFDQYDSAETVQRLETRKLPVDNEQWSNPFQHRIYRGARGAFYNGLVSLPDTDTITSEDPKAPGAIYELLRVEEIEGHKIDHPEGGSKDLADALVRVIEHVTGRAKSGFSFAHLKEGAGRMGDSGRIPVPGKTINPNKPPSPITGRLRAQEEKRAEERPAGTIDQGTGVVTPAEPDTARRFSFGTVHGTKHPNR